MTMDCNLLASGRQDFLLVKMHRGNVVGSVGKYSPLGKQDIFATPLVFNCRLVIPKETFEG